MWTLINLYLLAYAQTLAAHQGFPCQLIAAAQEQHRRARLRRVPRRGQAPQRVRPTVSPLINQGVGAGGHVDEHFFPRHPAAGDRRVAGHVDQRAVVRRGVREAGIGVELGVGVLQPLLEDPGVEEVMVRPKGMVFIERGGRVEALGQLAPDEHFYRVAAYVADRATDAVLAANDSMALGALEVLQMQGYRVPQDIAVTGFDDSEDGRHGIPPLTTVRQSVYEMGRQAGQLALERFVRHGRRIPARPCDA